jgi:hypothetical protein
MLHIAYTVDAGALTSILPSVSLIEMIFFYGGHKTDTGVVAGRRRLLLDWYGFRFSTTLCIVFVIVQHDSVVFSVVQAFVLFGRFGWVYIRLPGALSLVLNRPGLEGDHSTLSNAEVKNLWSYTSTPRYVFMALCLVKYRDNFTFYYPYFIRKDELNDG